MTDLMSRPALDIHGLSSGYGETRVLNEVSLSVRTGEIVALLGKNGMGKSTLIKTILGFVRPQGGAVSCLGKDMTARPPEALVKAGVSYAPQEKAIFQDLSIADNLRLASPNERAFKAMLDWVGERFPLFTARLKQKAGTLSGGEQKMLMLSRALMVRPRLVLIDEISEGLQPSVIDRIGEILKAESAECGTAILLVEQNIGFALRTAARWSVLDRGEIEESGEIDEQAQGRIIAHLSI